MQWNELTEGEARDTVRREIKGLFLDSNMECKLEEPEVNSSQPRDTIDVGLNRNHLCFDIQYIVGTNTG